MEEVNCYLCGSARYETVLDLTNCPDTYMESLGMKAIGVKRGIRKCLECGLAYRTPRFDEQEATALYAGPYRDRILRKQSIEDYFEKIVNLPQDQSELYAKVTWLKQHLDIYFTQAASWKMIDVGCGMGAFLWYFKRLTHGWEVKGLEPTVSVANVAGQKTGAQIIRTEYAAGSLKEKYDLITLVAVLEHILDPTEMLRSLKNDLENLGLLFIEVPSDQDFQSLDPCHDNFMMPHLYFFSKNTIEEILKRSGMVPVVVQYAVTHRKKTMIRALCRPMEA